MYFRFNHCLNRGHSSTSFSRTKQVFYQHLNSSSISQRRSKSSPALTPILPSSSGIREVKRERPFPNKRTRSEPGAGPSSSGQQSLQTEKSFEIEVIGPIAWVYAFIRSLTSWPFGICSKLPTSETLTRSGMTRMSMYEHKLVDGHVLASLIHVDCW